MQKLSSGNETSLRKKPMRHQVMSNAELPAAGTSLLGPMEVVGASYWSLAAPCFPVRMYDDAKLGLVGF